MDILGINKTGRGCPGVYREQKEKAGMAILNEFLKMICGLLVLSLEELDKNVEPVAPPPIY